MKNGFPALLIAAVSTVGLMTWSHAEPATGEDGDAGKKDKQASQDKYWDRVERARTDAKEAWALADRAAAESKLQAILRDRKIDDALARVQLETALDREELKKAEFAARKAEMAAQLLESQMKASKAQAELQHFANLAQIHIDTQITEAKIHKLEADLKLAKTMEIQKEVQKNAKP